MFLASQAAFNVGPGTVTATVLASVIAAVLHVSVPVMVWYGWWPCYSLPRPTMMLRDLLVLIQVTTTTWAGSN